MWAQPERTTQNRVIALFLRPAGYIVVHELVHLLEPTHDERFRALMRSFLPDWEDRRRELNRLPVRHEDWRY